MRPYQQLRAWRACHELFVTLYGVTSKWPAHERYGMTVQIRRAALSAGSNIAEGVVKHSPREFARFLDVTLGSLSEVSYQLLAARDVGVAKNDEFEQLERLRDTASRLTWSLRRATLERLRSTVDVRRQTVARRP